MQRDGARRTAVLILCLFAAAVVFIMPAPAQTPARQTLTRPSTDVPGIPQDTPAISGTFGPTIALTTRVSIPSTQDTSRIDRRPPQPVFGLSLRSNTQTSLTISWDPVQDESGIAYYLVVMNADVAAHGNIVATVTSTTAKLPWDGKATLIQVAAVDNAGNQGPWSALQIAAPRPSSTHSGSASPSADSTTSPWTEPSPTPTPIPSTNPSASGSASGPATPSPTAGPSPTPIPTATPHPTPSASSSPTMTVTPTPTASPIPPPTASATPTI